MSKSWWTVAHQAPLVHGILQARILKWLLFPSPEHLPDPGIEPASQTSLAFSSGFFTTNTTWEGPQMHWRGQKVCSGFSVNWENPNKFLANLMKTETHHSVTQLGKDEPWFKSTSLCFGPSTILFFFCWTSNSFRKWRFCIHSFLPVSESKTQKAVFFFPSCLAVSEPRSLSKSQTGFSDSKPRREGVMKRPDQEREKLAHTAEPQHWAFIWFWASWLGRFEADIWKRWLGCQNEAKTWFIVARICAQELNIWFYPPTPPTF